MIFDKYPYTNFHEMNDDWIIQTLQEFGKRLDDFVAANSLTYADPIGYDPATTYLAYTVVIYNDTAYMSKVTAPAGVLPTNDEYYLKIFPFGDLIAQMVDEGVTAGVAVLTERVDQYLARAGEEIDAAIANIPLEVSDWMNDHPEITTPIPTASVSYPKLTTQLQNILLYTGRVGGAPTQIPNTDFSQGTINQSTGTNMSANNVCRTDFYNFNDGILTVRTIPGYSVTLYMYQSNGTYTRVVIPAIGSDFDAVIVHRDNKYRFTIMKSDQSNFTPADLPNNPIHYREYFPPYDVAENFASVYSKNRFDGAYTVGGFVNQVSGSIEDVSTHSYTPFIDISNHAGRNTVISNTHTSSLGYTNLRYFFYKSDKSPILGSGGINPTLQNDATLNRDYTILTTPADAAYIRFSVPNVGFTAVTDWQVEYREVTEYSVYTGDYSGIKTGSIKENKLVEKLSSMTYGVKPSQATAYTLTDGQTLVVENNSVMKNQVISFFAKIDGAFGGVFVGHGKQSYGYYIKVDGTNITYCSNGALGTAVPHGLTISEFIGVTVEVDVDLNVKVTIATAGGTFTRTTQINSSWRGDVFAESIGTTFDNAVLTWDTPDYKCPFWAFGDSYFTLYTATRWTYYVAKQWGFDNILLNAYPGESSKSGYNDFVNALTHGKPKYVLWCLGMNDPDEASTVNATWLAKAQAVKELCTANEIELIYATIPETTASGTKNTLKNAWIRNSGVRYVDFAAAISDVTGWLSDDGVHPSEIGGRFMAAYLMASVPEIMQK